MKNLKHKVYTLSRVKFQNFLAHNIEETVKKNSSKQFF